MCVGLRDGDTLQLNKSCVPVLCPALTSPENGIILSTKKQYHFGDLVNIKCDFGYLMQGSSSLLCLSNGQWNGTVPMCYCNNHKKIHKHYSVNKIKLLIIFFRILLLQMQNVCLLVMIPTWVSKLFAQIKKIF